MDCLAIMFNLKCANIGVLVNYIAPSRIYILHSQVAAAATATAVAFTALDIYTSQYEPNRLRKKNDQECSQDMSETQ